MIEHDPPARWRDPQVLTTKSSPSSPLTKSQSPGPRVLCALRWPVGGIRTYVLYHYPALVAAGYRFTFLGPANADFRAFGKEVRGWPGVECLEAPLTGMRWRPWRTLRTLLRERRFALLHTHGLSAAPWAALANLGHGLPHVIHSHDVFLPRHAAGLKGLAQLWLLGRLLRRADALVSVSHDAQANLRDYLPGLAGGRCRLLPILNGIDIARLGRQGSLDPDLRKECGIDRDVFLVGFLGRFMEQKGFLPLLDALERLVARGVPRPFHLAAVGSGDFRREYREEALRRRLGRHVTFLDAVPNAGPVLRQLDLLVMPSLWEACPLLPMEAMAAGVPVLGSECVGLREVLRGTPSRTAPAGNADAWCRALQAALAAPWTRAARAYAAEARHRFAAEEPAERLLRLFDGLLARNRRHQPAAAAA
jgi:glycosyltransferase involved in cell wall biosynthesis